MTVITTEKLGETVGAQVVGVDRDRLLTDDELPAWTLDALEAHGALVFRDLHLDDATQVAFSKKLGRVEVFGTGENPEIFRVTLDPAKNRAAAYLRGTFDWHIDGCTDDIPIMATVLTAHAVAGVGRRDRVRQLVRGLRRPVRRREGDARGRAGRAHLRGGAAPGRTTTRRRRSWRCGGRGRRRSIRSCGRTARAGARSCSAPRPSHVVGMDPDEGRALLADLLGPIDHARPRLPPRVGGRRHGDLGQPRRAPPGLPVRPDVAPGHAPHDPARRGADPVSTERTAIVTGGASGIGLAIAERLAADGNAGRDLRPQRRGGRRGRGQDHGRRRHRHRRGRRRHRPGADRRRRRPGA